MADQSKKQTVGGVCYKYPASWIYELETEEHWRCYWRQQRLMQKLIKPGQHVLEIGVGSGFTANYLRSKGILVTTLDIDEEKQPDILANLVSYDFADKYDHILAFQVFEHISFIEFQKVLHKISRICNEYLFLSVPRNERRLFRCEFVLPKFGHRVFEIKTLKKRISTPHHFWELDDGTITKYDFKKVLTDFGYRLDRTDQAFSQWFYAFASPDFNK
ncbi:class I SAM-dependent methyltransferase [bacterium]|nr:class I SAM-dependent methyltransferase [bacterium]